MVVDRQSFPPPHMASSSTSSSPSTSPSRLLSSDKKHWWLSTRKVVDRYVKEARSMISTREEKEINSALSLLDEALALSPRHELALELRARCLLHLRKYKDVADMLQEYIPSYKMAAYSDDSSGSSSDNSSSQPLSRERVKLLSSPEPNSPRCDYPSFKCFSVKDLKKKVLHGFNKNSDKEGAWRYLVLGQACCHLGLMEDAMVLLQHGKRLASEAFRRESISWSDDSFSFTVDSDSNSSESSAFIIRHRPLTETELTSNLIAHIKHLLRRRSSALAALDTGLYAEAIRHFSKIVDGRKAAPQAFLAECYLHRSAAFKASGQIAASIADLNRTLALDPSSTSALQIRAGLFESIGCITDSVHDLEHVKFIYNSILRDRKPPGPAWKPRAVPYREIPGRLVTLGSKIQQLKERIAAGDTGKVDYYKLIGLRRGCSRSEVARAHLLLNLKHKPEKSMSFIDRCEFADEKDFESIKDRARMSAVFLFRLIQKGYSSVLATIAEEEAAEKERKQATLALQQAQAQHQLELQKQRVQVNEVVVPVPKVVVDRPDDMLITNDDNNNNNNNNNNYNDNNNVGSFPYQGVFCRDLAVVGSLLSHTGFNRPIAVKFEALTC